VKKLHGSITKAHSQTPLTQTRLRSWEDFRLQSFRMSGILKNGMRTLATKERWKKKSAKGRQDLLQVFRTGFFGLDKNNTDIEFRRILLGNLRPDYFPKNAAVQFKKHFLKLKAFHETFEIELDQNDRALRSIAIRRKAKAGGGNVAGTSEPEF
jgi:hypothetical protein